MSKVIKLKQSDIEKIVNNILQEGEFELDDFNTQIQPEELRNTEEFTLAQDPETGEYYVLKNGQSDNPEVVAKTK
jgi:hypothetical protein